MSKSKYPEQIDTSVEIPTVRDNITEIGSDVFNSLKSAVIAIEKTLGINPQGTSGNTVATRLNKSLDASGNILPSALNQAGVLSGPITNNEVADHAAISESKLNLKFSTSLLQNEISILQSEIQSFSNALLEISSKFSAHISPSALNRHSATSIQVSGGSSTSDDVAILALEAGTLQDTLNSIFNRHVNYTGLNISSTNNSHRASQIYFNNEKVQTITNANDLQGAVEDLANLNGSSIVNTNLNLNSNGIIRKGKVSDAFDSNNLNTIINLSPISYTQIDGGSKSSIIFIEKPKPQNRIEIFDLIKFSGSDLLDPDKLYQISNIQLDTDNNLSSVEIFGTLPFSNLGNLSASVFKNPYTYYNGAGLLSAVRPRENKTNTPDIQIANPNSATIISSKIEPNLITQNSHTFDISIDGKSSVTISTYDSNLAKQTIDSVINKINEQVVEKRLNFFAYKYKAENCYEVALVHNLPNMSGDSKNRTLKITSGSNNDGTSALGFSKVLDIEFEGTSGNSILLNGHINNIFGKIKVFTGANFEIIPGTQGVSSASENFISLGVRNGDLLVIENATDPRDDGTYRLHGISGQNAEIDSSHIFFGTLNQDSKIFILRSSAPIGELTFSTIGSTNGSLLFDIFMDSELDIHYQKRLEIAGDLRSGTFIAAIIDISKNFLISDETANLVINTDGEAYLTVGGLNGEKCFIANPGDYKIFSPDGFSFITLRVGTEGFPNSNLLVEIHGFNEVKEGNLKLSRGLFSTSLGRVLGYPTEPGVPVLIDQRKTGTIDESNISESFIEKYIEGPRHELRASGIIRGLKVDNIRSFSGYKLLDISAGVAVVNGIRVEYPGKIDHRVDIETDFYIAINSDGCILIQPSIEHPNGQITSPFYDLEVANLALISNEFVSDLRFFVDKIDLKLTTEIIVSNQKHFGHFSEISQAVEYAKRFTTLYPEAGTPSIKIREGLYEISAPIVIDFDLTIFGTGRTTVLTKSGALALGDKLTDNEPNPNYSLFYIGSQESNNSDRIKYGVSIKDLTYRVSDQISDVGSFITLSEEVGNSSCLFEFSNLVMEGPFTISQGNGVGEYFLVVGYSSPSTILPAAGIYGNIFIHNCLFSRAGLENGPCKLRDAAGMEYQNIIASNNIGFGLSPVLNSTSLGIFEEVTDSTLRKVTEVSNIIS